MTFAVFPTIVVENMAVTRSRTSSDSQSESESGNSGFSLRLGLSEKVFVTILTLVLSFIGSLTYGQNVTGHSSNCAENSDVILETPIAQADVKPR